MLGKRNDVSKHLLLSIVCCNETACRDTALMFLTQDPRSHRNHAKIMEGDKSRDKSVYMCIYLSMHARVTHGKAARKQRSKMSAALLQHMKVCH